MESSKHGENDHNDNSEFRRFAAKRIIFFTLIGVAVIWGVGAILGYFEKPAEIETALKSEIETALKSEGQMVHESSESSLLPETLDKAVEEKSSHTLTEEKGHETTSLPSEYDKHTAGSIMTRDFIALDKDLTAHEAIKYLKNTHHGIKQAGQMFVVDENGTLVGIITTNLLLLASSETPLKDFMSIDIYSVRTGIDTKMVKSLIDRHGLPAVPVIDNFNKLVGVVKANQVVHLAEQEVEETPSHVQAPEHSMTGSETETAAPTHETPASAHEAQAPTHKTPASAHEAQAPVNETPAPSQKAEALKHPAPAPTHEGLEKKPEHPAPATHEKKTAEAHKEPVHRAPEAEEVSPSAVGVAFVKATIAPLDYELNERFYGWRPNDILDFTDNINNYQLGVLEVTRRTVVALTERISRTGATAAFDENLENAMNWLMIKARKYWFPSPEAKYNDSLMELRIYMKRLEKGEAKFHTRTDNLIPLLMDFEDLLGSCEENLVKDKEDDGSSVSFFKADDYFFYAKGVATAMGSILEGVLEDFRGTIDSRLGIDTLHHAIESCHHAAEIHPWIITNSSLGGILANHRANMAAPLSHARFYIGVLIKTLST
ncbi:MAG: DUF2333 family protein [Desulfobacterales bacterium]